MAHILRTGGEALHNAVFYASQSVIEAWAFAPLDKESPTQYDNPFLECARRVRIFAINTLLLIALLITCGPIGMAFKASANAIDGAKYTEMKGTAEPTPGRVKSVLSANVCMFPGGLPFVMGGFTPAKHRYDALSQMLLKEDPDVVCLQELPNLTAHPLAKRLKDNYASFYFNGSASSLVMDAGLFIATKKEPSGPVEFVEFDERKLGMHRGFFIIPFEDKVVVTTHMEAGNEERAVELRNAQFKQMNAYLNAHYPGRTISLCGDLNIERRIDGHPSEYKSRTFTDLGFQPVLVGQKTATDAYQAAISHGPARFDPVYQTEAPVQLDYFAVKNGQIPRVRVLNMNGSDHAPLLASF
ncbi:MAG: hypothetical protein SP1CHLAM54_13990 [Chlamydiia bacterium]|nr:hypothetical protein [Chlamydiia bacterium]MCH9616291.1 hypothetical protein [Chlamydiia bacterium]MCH9629723.1 hypothetical protein [Chlamydiia bacterium]